MAPRRIALGLSAARRDLGRDQGNDGIFRFSTLVRCGKVDMLDLDADHIGHGGGVHKVDVGRAVFAVVVIFPVLHEDADHLVALLLEKVGGDGGVHSAREADDNALFGMGSHCPDCIFMRWPPCAGVQNA